MDDLLIAGEHASKILESHYSNSLEKYTSDTILVINLVIIISIIILTGAIVFNTVVYKNSVTKFLEAVIKT